MFSGCIDYRTLSCCAPCLLIIQLLLHLAGDVHLNPGPKNTNKTNALSVIRVNVRSLKNKIDILACDIENHDIVTVSETWPSDQVGDEEISITGFQPTIRKDRPNDPHGRVAVYVKMILFVELDLTFYSSSRNCLGRN